MTKSIKAKYFTFILLFVILAFLGLAGCGDIYQNLRVTVSTNNVELYLDRTEFDESGVEVDLSTTTITATVEGLSGDMISDVDFWYRDNNIVNAEVVSVNGNESTIRITARNAGTTVLRVVSRELSTVYSEDITVTVYRDPDSMHFLDQKISVPVGTSLELVTNNLIGFEPARVYPSTATFSLLTPDNELWNDAYGTRILNGVSIQDNVLIVDENAERGIVQIEALMPNGVHCAFNVLIYSNIDESQIHLYSQERRISLDDMFGRNNAEYRILTPRDAGWNASYSSTTVSGVTLSSSTLVLASGVSNGIVQLGITVGDTEYFGYVLIHSKDNADLAQVIPESQRSLSLVDLVGQANFSILDTPSPLWDSSYGTYSLRGVSISNGILNIDSGYGSGVVQIAVNYPDGSTDTMIIMVYGNSTSAIKAATVGEVETLKFAINSDEMNRGSYYVVNDDTLNPNVNIRVTTGNSDVLVASSLDNNYRFTLTSMESGTTTVTVNIDIIDPVTNEIYTTFSRTYNVEVIRIARQVILSGDGLSATADPAEMLLQDYYYNVLGAEVNVMVSPEEARDRSYIIRVVEIDGSTENITAGMNSLNIYVNGRNYVNDQGVTGYNEYIYGERLQNGTSFYVSLDSANNVISHTVKLAIIANTYDPDLPYVQNIVTFTITAGVTEITSSSDIVEVGLGETSEFTLSYLTSAGANVGTPDFEITVANEDIISLTGANYTYTVSGLKEGYTEITFTAASGVTLTLPVYVYIIPLAFYISGDHSYENSNIASDEWNDAEYVNPADNLIDAGVTSVTVKRNNRYYFDLVALPAGITANSLSVSIGTNDANGEYISLSQIDEDYTFSFYARNVTTTPVIITVSFSYRTHVNGVWTTVASTRTLEVNIYNPVTLFYWNGTNNATSTTVQLYDKNSLNINQQNLSTTQLNIYTNTDATVYQNGGSVEWTVDNPDLLSISENGFSATITANLTDYSLSSYTAYVYATINDYGTERTITCRVNIIVPQMVESIEVTNYNDNEGVRLNDLGTQQRTSFTINTRVLPNNAFNSEVGYLLYSAENIDGKIVATEIYTGAESDAVVRFDPTEPNRIIAQNAGYAVIRIYPLDRVNSENVNFDSIYHVDIWVIVEDGEVNPYSIYTAEEFVSIGSSAEALTKNYVLMQTIDLSNYSSYFPLGSEFGSNFSGSLDSYNYSTNGRKMSVLGITLNNSFALTSSEILGGLFGRVSGSINNIDFVFSERSAFNLADITASNLDVHAIKIGLLAGVLDGEVNNVVARMNNFTNTSNMISINGLDNADYAISVGGLAGEINGSASASYVNVAIRTDLGVSTLYLGGLAGIFNGTTIGQAGDEVTSRVRITASRAYIPDSENSRIGGLIGYIAGGNVYGQNVTGQVVATLYDYVGGFAGRNDGTLGYFDTANNTEYRVLSGVKTQGHNYVGGLIGYNTGTVNYARVENYEDTTITGVNQAVVSGNNYVGGLVGYSEGGRVTYSYSIGYISQDFTANGSYNGDVIGAEFVGGLIGYAHNTYITSSFAANCILVNSTNTGTAGGLIGQMQIDAGVDISTSTVWNAYANGYILTDNLDTTKTGELIGVYDVQGGSAYVDTCYAHVVISNFDNSTVYRNLFGTNVSGANVANSYYLADTTESITDIDNITSIGVSHDDMIAQDGGFGSNAYIGWGFGDANSNQAWVIYDPDTMQGVNDDLPLLYDRDRGWLYNQAINNIEISYATLQQDGDLLPTFFNYNDLGTVVVLENIDEVDGEKRLNIHNTGTDTANGLFNINVLPLLDPTQWSLSVTSSNSNIAEVVQDNLNLVDAYIVFKTTGVVNITLQSLLDVSASVTVTINVVGGFNEFDILDENDDSITTSGSNVISIKQGSGALLLQYFETSANYNDSYGIKFSTNDTSYFEFSGYEYTGTSVYIPYTQPNLLGGVAATTDAYPNGLEMRACPYFVLVFSGAKINYSLENYVTPKNFYVNVYYGITQAGFNSTDAQITSGEQHNLILNVVSDNPENVVISNPKVLRDGVELTDYSEVLTVLDRVNGDGTVTQNYLLELDDSLKNLTENRQYQVSVDVSDESGLYGTYVFDIIFTPSPITRIDISHFTYGADSMTNGEVPSNLISPGTRGVLRVEVTPNYSHFDYLLFNSTLEPTSNQRVIMQQMVLQNGSYRTIEANYDSNGALIVQKITGYDVNGNAYFDGTVFVSTLVGTNLTEGYNFTISVTAMRNGESSYVFPPVYTNLVTTFAPHATLTLNSTNGDAVAKGTVANFVLTGELFNSTITLETSYGNGQTGIQYSGFASDIRLTYGVGARETVNETLPFYVGIGANAPNGRITVTVTINSTTATGGQLNPIVLQYTIYIVDFAVESVYAENAENGTLSASVRSYTLLEANWRLVEPSIEDYRTYVGGDETAFNNAFNEMYEKAEAKLKVVNERGNGEGGVWYYNDGNGYFAVQTALSYPDFIISYTQMNNGISYYLIQGKTITTGIPFRLSFTGYYVYNESLGVYEFTLDNELSSVAPENILNSYQHLYEQDFNIDVINDTSEDTPDYIDSAEALRSMTAGVNHMLTSDIILDSWTPIDTAIASLDGNGYVIYLRSFAENTADTQNYGLFSTLQEGTVLKNLIIDVSHNIYVNLQNASTVNFGFIAGVNDGGVIYNCDVVVTESKEGWRTIYNSPDGNRPASNNSDFAFATSVFNRIMNDTSAEYNTLASTFILTDLSTSARTVTTYIGGLVGQNNGYITNSRVGRIDTDNALGFNRGYALQGLNIFASGNVGGLAGQNTGVISNSYFANGTVVNYGMSIYTATNRNGARTGGLVAEQTNTGRIESSYAIGQLGENAQAELGGIIAYGTIGGLVHSNAGSITNSYTNLPLSSSNAMGGFVYENTGNASINYCYSMSLINSTGLINGVFIGVDAEGTVQNGEDATVENSFYYSSDNTVNDSSDPATAISANEWGNALGSAFEGFAISDNENSTWYMDVNRLYLGPQLTFADKVYYSHRGLDYTYDASSARGSETNPIIIASLKNWQNVFNYSDTSGLIRSEFMTANPDYTSGGARYQFGTDTMHYYVALASDINFGNSMHSTATDTLFKGILLGNGYTLAGLSYRQSSTVTTAENDFGVFNQLVNASVTNLNLEVSGEITTRARHMGVLAGSVHDSYVENVNISGSTASTSITGLNMTGALAGFVYGNSEIRNITASISVNSISATVSSGLYLYYNDSETTHYADYSYAGGVIGVVDLSDEEGAENNPRIQNLSVSGNTDIYGEIAGGVVGMIGTTSEAKGLNFILDITDENAPRIRGSNFSGGLVGENRGHIMSSFVGIAVDEQIAEDSAINSTDNAANYIGYTGLFENTEESTAVGGLVGLNIAGSIEYSYSRVAVISSQARIVGGLVGMAINAPNSYDTSSGDVTLSYLRNLSVSPSNIYNYDAIDEMFGYSYSNGSVEVRGDLNFSGTLYQVYTTGAINGGEILGGAVGMMVGAPIYSNYTDALVVAVNNYNASDRTLIDKINDENVYFGGVVGYVGYTMSGTTSVAPFISNREVSGEYTIGTPAQTVRAVTSIAGNSLDAVGNAQAIISVRSTDFLTCATSTVNDPFASFSDTVWLLDSTRVSHRFPVLMSNYSATISEIDSVEDFFNYLSDTNTNSYGRIVTDLTITGDDWNRYILSNNLNSITEGNDYVSGRLEGAVPITVSGQETTRSATITFTNFTTSSGVDVSNTFWSLFGYTEGFRLINVDFVFDFTINMTNHTISNFGVLARESNGSSFENVSVTFTENNSVTVNNLGNIALITGTSQNSSYTNVVVNGTINTISDGFTSSTGSVAIGALFGSGTVSNTIYGTSFGTIGVNYTSNNNYILYIGGLAGTTDGLLSVRSVSAANQYNLTTNISITANSNTNIMYVGGVVGRTNGATQLTTLRIDGTLNVTRTNATSTQNSNSYIGGIAGSLYNTKVSDVTSNVEIASNIAGGNVYLGGLAGNLINNHEFTGTNSSMQFSGYVTNGANFTGSISHTADSNLDIYAGGIYGFVQNRLNMSSSTALPVGQARLILNAMHSSGSITVNTAAVRIYGGGLIGRAAQGVMNSGTYEELSAPNNILRISSSAFTGSLDVTNNQSSSESSMWLGGIVGNSQLAVYDSLSNGTIFFNAENALSLFAGGIAGSTNTDIGYCIALSSVQYDMPSTSANTSVNAIRGIQDNENARIVYSYYSGELCGILDLFGTNLTAMQMLDATNFRNNNTNILTNFTYATRTDADGNTVQASFMYPTEVEAYLDLTSGSANVPVFVENMSMLQGQLLNEETPNKIIYINTEQIDVAGIPNIEIANARKIVGNGVVISVADTTTSGRSSSGVFVDIPRNVVVSGINVEYAKVLINASSDFDFGGLAGNNFGSIYGVSVRGVASESIQNTTASGFANLTSRYTDNFTGLTNNDDAQIFLNTSGQYAINFGGVVGLNRGSIVGVLSDINIYSNGGSVSLGGIAGSSINSVMNNNMTQGRIIVDSMTNETFIGGIAGVATNSFISSTFANNNITVFTVVSGNVGLAFGSFSGLSSGIVVNSDVSGNLSIGDTNSYYTNALTTSQYLTASSINSIINNTANYFNSSIWTIGDNTQNYGYPYLNVLNVDFATGDGTQANPYKLREGSEFIRLTQNTASGRYFTLTRDVMISTDTLSLTSSGTLRATEFNGGGYVAVIEGLITPQSSGGTVYASLFNNISNRSTVQSFGVVINESAIINENGTGYTIYFGGLAGTNNGTITNCAVQSLGNITLNSLPNSRLGGLVGQNTNIIENSWADVDFVANDGFIGGLVGLLGTNTSADSESTAVIRNSFASGDLNITQNTANSNYTSTAVGGLVGVANAESGTGSIRDSYVYGAKINVSYRDTEISYVGALIGNAIKFSTYRTYAYVFTPSAQDTNYAGAGVYTDLAMTGNVIEGAFDSTSWVSVWLGPYVDVPVRQEANDLCAVINISTLRTTAIGTGVYSEWITSAWTRNPGVAERNEFVVYLNNVTPVDKQERAGDTTNPNDIFDY